MSTDHFTADGVEVITSDTHRRRDRNAIRAIGGVDVLPPDVQTKVSALQHLDGAAQATAITAILSHSRTGLLAAIAAHDLPQIVEFKKKAVAIQEIAKQVRMGKEFQLDAAEFVRRAERGLGVAIREGQERGEIRTSGKKNVVYDRWSGTKSETSPTGSDQSEHSRRRCMRTPVREGWQ
ncbi:hypothetical protein SEA_RITA_48 [Mycobacterium phage Rita]|nr:hypothetical protein SEA_RITA_48 [Mycobacterium phage Rita]